MKRAPNCPCFRFIYKSGLGITFRSSEDRKRQAEDASKENRPKAAITSPATNQGALLIITTRMPLANSVASAAGRGKKSVCVVRVDAAIQELRTEIDRLAACVALLTEMVGSIGSPSMHRRERP